LTHFAWTGCQKGSFECDIAGGRNSYKENWIALYTMQAHFGVRKSYEQ
jgi:hypothetical protein